ncbi:UNVERIFIED_CONTAM: hypothetical protein BEN50_02510 [Euhalothece sp. KZN 001]
MGKSLNQFLPVDVKVCSEGLTKKRFNAVGKSSWRDPEFHPLHFTIIGGESIAIVRLIDRFCGFDRTVNHVRDSVIPI